MELRILEVGPRDGLQNEEKILSHDKKYELVSKLIQSGLKHIEAAAFVNPKAIPQMAGSAELSRALVKDFPTVNFYSLVPNLQGLEAAMESGIKNIGLLSSCCELFAQKNLNTSIDGSLKRIAEIIENCPPDCFSRLYLSMSFHSPFSGSISNETYNNIMEKVADTGINEIVISDTTGKATADKVNNRIFLSQKFFGTQRIACHFHDTFGNAMANIKEALRLRINKFDSSIAGLGGCPYSPGAKGNVSTNTLVDFCIENNISTGIIPDKLNEAADFIRGLISNEEKS